MNFIFSLVAKLKKQASLVQDNSLTLPVIFAEAFELHLGVIENSKYCFYINKSAEEPALNLSSNLPSLVGKDVVYAFKNENADANDKKIMKSI